MFAHQERDTRAGETQMIPGYDTLGAGAHDQYAWTVLAVVHLALPGARPRLTIAVYDRLLNHGRGSTECARIERHQRVNNARLESPAVAGNMRAVVYYSDEYVKAGGRWLFQSRVIHPLLPFDTGALGKAAAMVE